MRFDGHWHLSKDGILRPAITAYVVDFEGIDLEFKMLVDTGADRTIFAEALLTQFEFDPEKCSMLHVEGVGGEAESIVFDTKIFLTRDGGLKIPVKGRFAIFTDPNALEISILGRDVLNNFALIVDRAGDVVCLLTGNHRYIIQET